MDSVIQSLSQLSTDERGRAAQAAGAVLPESMAMDQLLSDENIVGNILDQLVPLSRYSWTAKTEKYRIKDLMNRHDLNGLEGVVIHHAAGRCEAEVSDDLANRRVPFVVTLASGEQQRIKIKLRNLESTAVRPLTQRAEVVSARPWLRSARQVCHVWRRAAARPFLAAVFTVRFLDRFEMTMEMLHANRDHGLLHPTAGAGLSERATEVASWLIGGWENGFNSILGVTDQVAPRLAAAAVIKHLQMMKVRAQYYIFAPTDRWPQWREALAALALPHSELGGEEADGFNLEEARLQLPAVGVVLSCADEPAPWTKFAIFDEGASVVPWYRDERWSEQYRCEGSNTWLQLTERELPTNVYELVDMAGTASPLVAHLNLVSDDSIDAMLDISRVLSTGDEDLEAWSYEGFLVPRLRTALLGGMCLQWSGTVLL